MVISTLVETTSTLQTHQLSHLYIATSMWVNNALILIHIEYRASSILLCKALIDVIAIGRSSLSWWDKYHIVGFGLMDENIALTQAMCNYYILMCFDSTSVEGWGFISRLSCLNFHYYWDLTCWCVFSGFFLTLFILLWQRYIKKVWVFIFILSNEVWT